MRSVAAVLAYGGEAEEGIAGLVIEWQRLDAFGASAAAQRLMGRIVEALLPTLRKVAHRFGPNSRGSLSLEDLVQVGSIEVIKFVPKYQHARRGSQTFEDHVYRRALRACVHQIQMHSTDVHASKEAQRYPEKLKNQAISQVTCEENTGFEPDGDNPTPEQLMNELEQSKALRDAINLLPFEQRSLVTRAFGIGRPAASLRDIARHERLPRSRLASELDKALERLREVVCQ